MTTSDERIAKALEALTRIAQDIKDEWRAEREAQARGSDHGLLDTNTMRPLKTASGRLVGYAFPNESITVHDTAPVDSALTKEQLLKMPANAARAAQGMQPHSSERFLIPLPDTPYIVVESLEPRSSNTTPLKKYRFTGMMYQTDGHKSPIGGTFTTGGDLDG